MKNNDFFKGRVAWITGASSGIGEALVYGFAERGAIVVASSNDPSGLERVKNNCSGNSERVFCVPFDLAEMSGINKIIIGIANCSLDVLSKFIQLRYELNSFLCLRNDGL